MGTLELSFEAGDLAEWVWAAIALLAVVEAARYVASGRRPAALPARAVLLGIGLSVGAAFLLTGRVVPGRFSHGATCLILAFLLLPWVGRAYARTTRPVALPGRLLLLALRTGATSVALLMIARPVLLWTTASHERAVVGILQDTSQSMNVRDVLEPPAGRQARGGAPDRASTEPISRLEAVGRMFEASDAAVRRLEGKMDVEYMTFDARIRRVNGVAARAEGGVTALSRSVNAAREALLHTGSRIAGLIVISDGRDTSSSNPDPLQAGDELAMAGIPLYCVGVGDELPSGQTRSLTARRMDVPDRISVLNRLAVGAEFLAAGLAGTQIEIRLEYDGTLVETQTLAPTQVRELIRADLSHVPTEGGLHRVTVTAVAADLEEPHGRVSLSRYVRVTDDMVQVLYIDRARYERAAIARALEYAKEINLTKIDLDRPADASTAALLPNAAAWRTFHVVLLGDVERAHLPASAMVAIAELVGASGRGAALLGGTRTLGSGQYAGTPLDALFPADLAVRGQLEDKVAFELTPAGRLHPVCRLTEDGSDPWKTFPPFAGAARLGAVPPTAEVLMRAVAGDPLLVVQQKGAGRVAALAFDSSWQWPFAGDAGMELHRRFWRQLVLWLANRRPEVWAISERSQYDLDRLKAGDERVVLRAGVNEPSTGGQPARSSVTGEIIGPDGQPRQLTWVADREGFEARPAIDRPGRYRVVVDGMVASESAGRAETGFVVEAVDRELVEPFADLETLRQMALRTASIGGEYVPMQQFPQLLEKIRAGGMEERVVRVQRHYLVDDHPWSWLLVFVGLLACEWIIRRRVGLV